MLILYVICSQKSMPVPTFQWRLFESSMANMPNILGFLPYPGMDIHCSIPQMLPVAPVSKQGIFFAMGLLL